MPLTNDGAELFFNGGLLASTIYAGLHPGQPITSNELNATDYARLALAPLGGGSAWDIALNVASLNADMTWDDDAADEWGDPTHVGFWNVAPRGTGTLLFWGEIGVDVPVVTTGTRVFVNAGDFVLTLPTGDLTNDGADLGFRSGLIGSTVHAALHAGDPGGANELSGSDYQRLTLATGNWTRLNNTITLAGDHTWDMDAAETWGDPTHVGFWSAATGGDLLFKGDISVDVPEITRGTRIFVNAADFSATLPLAA